MHTKLKSQIRLIRWMIRRVRLLEIRKHTCRVSVIEISYTYRCIYKQIEHSELLLEVVPKWVLAPPKDGWKQFPPDINWKGAELDTAYMQKLNLRIP